MIETGTFGRAWDGGRPKDDRDYVYGYLTAVTPEGYFGVESREGYDAMERFEPGIFAPTTPGPHTVTDDDILRPGRWWIMPDVEGYVTARRSVKFYVGGMWYAAPFFQAAYDRGDYSDTWGGGTRMRTRLPDTMWLQQGASAGLTVAVRYNHYNMEPDAIPYHRADAEGLRRLVASMLVNPWAGMGCCDDGRWRAFGGEVEFRNYLKGYRGYECFIPLRLPWDGKPEDSWTPRPAIIESEEVTQ